jgi:hypothetical protein
MKPILASRQYRAGFAVGLLICVAVVVIGAMVAG